MAVNRQQKQTPLLQLSLEEGGAVLIALALDLLGEPPLAIHPVVWYGKLIKRLEQWAPHSASRQLRYGVLMLLLAAPAAYVPNAFIHYLADRIRAAGRRRGYDAPGALLYALIEGISLKPFFALTMLVRAGRLVRRALERNDLPAARAALLHLVSRDRANLTAELTAAAAIESLAENVSDAVVAPLFYYVLAGLPGAASYRLFNTFDSMIGYHGHYEYLGKVAARLDDLLNLLPARLSALLIIALAPLFGGSQRAAWHTWRRDAAKTESPNAGHPMAAAAGALGIRLEKVDHYILGDAHNTLTPERMRQAERMVWWVGGSAIALTALLRAVWKGAQWKR